MGDRYPIQIRIVTKVDDEELEHTASGTLYDKPSGWYLHYEETDDSGNRSRTILKVSRSEMEASVKRSGAVASDMRFIRNSSQQGHYRTGGLELRVTTVLHALQVNLNQGRGTITWEYDMEVGDMPARRYQLTYELS